MSFAIETIVVGPFAVNCYLVYDDAAGDGVIIDPGADANEIIDVIKEAQFEPKAILLTHGHGDHIAAVEAVKNKYKIPLYVGKGEEELLKNPSANVSAMLGVPIVAPPPDRILIDEEEITFGKLKFRVLATPGHSPGGVCYLNEENGKLFCGDSLFAGSIGRTDFPGCSHQILIESILTKIMRLPDNVECFPGHGPSTTVGRERTANPFLIGGMFA